MFLPTIVGPIFVWGWLCARGYDWYHGTKTSCNYLNVKTSCVRDRAWGEGRLLSGNLYNWVLYSWDLRIVVAIFILVTIVLIIAWELRVSISLSRGIQLISESEILGSFRRKLHRGDTGEVPDRWCSSERNGIWPESFELLGDYYRWGTRTQRAFGRCRWASIASCQTSWEEGQITTGKKNFS